MSRRSRLVFALMFLIIPLVNGAQFLFVFIECGIRASDARSGYWYLVASFAPLLLLTLIAWANIFAEMLREGRSS